MKIKHIFSLAAGLGAIAFVTILRIMAVNSHFPSSLLLMVAIVILTLAGFELWHFAFSPGENEYRFFSRGYRGLFFDIMCMLLSVCLMLATINFKNASSPLCAERLGAGFPATFICDASGESPLSSVGKIDWADIDNLNPVGAFVDILFYLALLGILRNSFRRITRASQQR
jgi:hypothetical protein